ncbi:MAG: sulfurtransferase tusE [Proteobacteria bacterium]|nr:sulfurtransferase tusE [Pseudomonadota bacterium]
MKLMIEVNGVALPTTESGFLVNVEDWSEAAAVVLAHSVGIGLSEAHWEIVRFIRDYYLQFAHLPNARMFVKAVQKRFGDEKGNTRYLMRLFPDSPVRQACLIAGLPKPPGCL